MASNASKLTFGLDKLDEGILSMIDDVGLIWEEGWNVSKSTEVCRDLQKALTPFFSVSWSE